MRSVLSDLRELRRGVSELFENDPAQEEAASYALAASARRFSQNTKEVVDDKLSFSATLMRAGEVSAANRLLEEVSNEVRSEEAALIETVNEVKVAQTMRRERITRLRLARMVAVATLGASLLTFSAAGMAIAGFFRDRAAAESRDLNELTAAELAATSDGLAGGSNARSKKMRRLLIGDVRLMLTKSQFQRLKELTGGGSIDEDGLASLLTLLPQPLADTIEEAMTVAKAEADEIAPSIDAVALEAPRVDRKKRRAARAARAAAAEEKNEAAEEQPEEQPSPSPSEPEENGSTGEEEGGDEESKEPEEEGDTGPPSPLPIRP